MQLISQSGRGRSYKVAREEAYKVAGGGPTNHSSKQNMFHYETSWYMLCEY